MIEMIVLFVKTLADLKSSLLQMKSLAMYFGLK